MLLMVEGSVSDVRPVLQKALAPMVSTPSGIVTEVKPEQLAKQDSPIDASLAIVTDGMLVQLLKALPPMDFKVDGNETLVMPSQP